MTPDKARDLLDGTTPGPWEWCEGKDQNGEFVALRGHGGVDALRTWDGDLYASGVHGTNADKALAAAAPTLAALVAGMREEWWAEFQGAEGGWHMIPDHKGREWGGKERAGAIAAQWHNDGFRARIVRRCVTEPEGDQ